MEGQIGAKPARSRPAHLMCGSRIWTIAAFLCSAYFAKIAVERVRADNIFWSHDTLDVATHGVWVLFMIGLITETRCWKERVFFGLVLANFTLATAMGLWNSSSLILLNKSRILSAVLWGLAAAVSFVLIFMRRERV